MAISYTTIVHCHNQKFDNNTTHRGYSDFNSYTLSWVCVCVALFKFVPCVTLYNHLNDEERMSKGMGIHNKGVKKKSLTVIVQLCDCF